MMGRIASRILFIMSIRKWILSLNLTKLTYKTKFVLGYQNRQPDLALRAKLKKIENPTWLIY